VLCGYCVGCGRGVKGGTYDPNHNITCRSWCRFESRDPMLCDSGAGSQCCHCYSNYISPDAHT
jgi:hypothetical protein